MGFWDYELSCAAFRVNFASCNSATGKLDRRTARDLEDQELEAIVSEIRNTVTLQQHPEVDFEITGFGRHRGVVCFKSASTTLSGEVSNTDPGFRRLGAFGVPREQSGGQKAEVCQPLDGTEAARATALVVNEFVDLSSEVMKRSETNLRRVRAGKLPTNVLLFRDGGHRLPALPRLAVHNGLTASLYGQIPAERGLCTLVGGTYCESRPRSGQRWQEYYRDLAKALTESSSDLAIVHLKGPDEPGHDAKPHEKVVAIEQIDQVFVSELVERMTSSDVCIVTCDHATPCEAGVHTADSVPALICGPGIPADHCHRLSEVEAAQGALPVKRAAELLAFATSKAGVRC